MNIYYLFQSIVVFGNLYLSRYLLDKIRMYLNKKKSIIKLIVEISIFIMELVIKEKSPLTINDRPIIINKEYKILKILIVLFSMLHLYHNEYNTIILFIQDAI